MKREEEGMDELNKKNDKLISIQDAINAFCLQADDDGWWCGTAEDMEKLLKDLPSAQPERCEYYALCRHGRDENKLRADLGVCDYCHEDSDGYVKPVEKNCHAFVRSGMDGWELSLKANGWHGSAKIKYCPMCGRRLRNDKR